VPARASTYTRTRTSAPRLTVTSHAVRALGGPDWLVRRRAAAAERLADLTWPTSREEIWRYSAIDDFDPERFSPIPPEELGTPGQEGAPGGGLLAAEAGERSGLVVVRNGRVVHHELDPALDAKGVHVCGLATCAAGEAEPWLGMCSDASPDAFTLLHDAFLAGGAFVHVPAGVVVEKPIVVLHWSHGEGRASFPHTLVVAEDGAQVAVVDRFSSAGGVHLVDAVVELVLGDARQTLPATFARTGPVDLFLHDSLHTLGHMLFEFGEAWSALRPGGLLVSDDAFMTPAFWWFTRRRGVPLRHIGAMGLTRRPGGA